MNNSIYENMDSPCNICGRGWPYHEERCSYRVTLDERNDARKLARGLFMMITREQWRSTGGDDGQGHYEGDYRAANIEKEILSWGKIQ